MANATLPKRDSRPRKPGAATSSDSKQAAFRRRLRELADEAGGSSYFLAKKAGLSQGALRNYLDRGGEPTRTALVRLAEACGVRLEWLITGAEPKTPDELAPVSAPRIEQGIVWVPRLAGERDVGACPRQTVPFSRELLESRWHLDLERLGAVTVEDDTMEPILREGDLVLVTRCEQANLAGGGGVNGLYALLDDGCLCLRRVASQGRMGVRVSCDNPAYDDLVLTPEEAKERLRLVGRVAWCGGRGSRLVAPPAPSLPAVSM